jgi:hypothetical protein
MPHRGWSSVLARQTLPQLQPVIGTRPASVAPN